MTAVVFGSLLAAIDSYLRSDRTGDKPAQYAEVVRRPLPDLPEG